MKLIAATLLLAASSYMPTDAERARWTYHDMRSIQTVIEAYATDYQRYPAVKTMDELLPLVAPRYIMALPMHDAWGNPYRIESTEKSYRIISAGSDGKFDEPSWATAAKDLPYDADAVIDHGKFTRRWAFK
jgi:type II secretory pathway pseudopilin PulG